METNKEVKNKGKEYAAKIRRYNDETGEDTRLDGDDSSSRKSSRAVLLVVPHSDSERHDQSDEKKDPVSRRQLAIQREEGERTDVVAQESPTSALTILHLAKAPAQF